jgi:hypothetical protein
MERYLGVFTVHCVQNVIFTISKCCFYISICGFFIIAPIVDFNHHVDYVQIYVPDGDVQFESILQEKIITSSLGDLGFDVMHSSSYRLSSILPRTILFLEVGLL